MLRGWHCIRIRFSSGSLLGQSPWRLCLCWFSTRILSPCGVLSCWSSSLDQEEAEAWSSIGLLEFSHESAQTDCDLHHSNWGGSKLPFPKCMAPFNGPSSGFYSELLQHQGSLAICPHPPLTFHILLEWAHACSKLQPRCNGSHTSAMAPPDFSGRSTSTSHISSAWPLPYSLSPRKYPHLPSSTQATNQEQSQSSCCLTSSLFHLLLILFLNIWVPRSFSILTGLTYSLYPFLSIVLTPLCFQSHVKSSTWVLLPRCSF